MSKPTAARYRTTNWSRYSASPKKRGSLPIWLDKDMTWLALPDGSPGRPAVFSDAAIQFCLTIKVLFKLPLRQTTGMVASLLTMADLNWAVPDHTTLCRPDPVSARRWPLESACGQHRHQVPWRWRMAGPQAWRSGTTPMAQGPSGHRHGHVGHPGGGVYPRQRWRQSRLNGTAGPDPRRRRDRHGDRRRCL